MMTTTKRVLLGSAVLAASLGLMGCSSFDHQSNPYTGTQNPYNGARAVSPGTNVAAPNMDQNHLDVITHALEGAGVKTIVKGDSITLAPKNAILFANGSAALTAQDKATLTSVATVLKHHTASPWVDKSQYIDSTGTQQFKTKATYKIKIVGHASSPGATGYNQKLSEQRAHNVATFLAAHGVQEQRMIISANGETTPVASNATAKGQAANRRVDIILVPPTTVAAHG